VNAEVAVAGGGSSLLAPLLRPRGIALVGVSRDEASITARPAHYLRSVGFPGEVFVVKPGADGDIVHGLPVVASVAEVADRCDAAMVMVAADRVVGAIEDCAEAGIERAVCITSGFDGEAGAVRRGEILEVLERHPRMRLIGPNSAGLIGTAAPSVLSFSSVLQQERLWAGRTSLVSQSGAMGNGLLLALLRRGGGIRNWVSTGDELSVGAIELCCELLRDPGTEAVGLFLEGITDAAFLPELAATVAAEGKPIVALRAGGAGGAKDAAYGHTGRVVGDDAIAHAALEAAGVGMVATAEEMLDALTVLSVLPRRRKPGGGARVGVITVSGGLGVVAADEIGRSPNLELAPLTDLETTKIAAASPASSPVANPYDVATLGDPTVFLGALRALGEVGDFDALVAVISTLAHDYELYSAENFEGLPPLVFSHLSPEERFTPEQARRLASGGVASVPSTRGAVRALALWAGPAAGPAAPEAPSAATGRQLGMRRTLAAFPALAPYAAATIRIESVDEAAAALERFGVPIAIKAEGSVIAHRTELGAAATALADEAEVREAFARVARICEARGEEVVAQPMAPPGVELFVSVLRDAEVGAAVICRPGGVLVELGAGATILTGSRQTWERALARGPVGLLLDGYRGAPPADTGALLDLFAALVEVLDSDPGLVALESNPVFVHRLAPDGGGGVTAVDLLATCRSAG
jgi:acyl-CoA synthetase (NDP forming)